MSTTADINVNPEVLKPDTLYRDCPCFNISKKELREYTRNGVVPERVKEYKKRNEGKCYMRHGTHLNFRYDG